LKQILTIFLLAFAIQTEAKVLKCESLFSRISYPHNQTQLVLDKNLGLLNQNDSRLAEAQLINNKSSMLCGPTCIYNIVEKFKVERNEKKFPENNAQELISYIKDIFPKHEIATPELIHKGLHFDKLVVGLKAVAQKNNLNLKIRETTTVVSEMGDFDRNTRDFGLNINDLKNATSKGRTAIVLIGYYRTGNLLKIDRNNRLGGHYMIVAGHDTLNPNQIIFQDPHQPTIYKKINLRPVEPANFVRPTYELDIKVTPWWDPRKVTTLVERVLFLDAE